MRSAALLPTPGDPFLVRYWLTNYERVWRGEVDELLVHVNRQPDAEVRRFIRAAVEDVGGTYLEGAATGSHGAALDELVRATDAELVVLLEDDALVRHPSTIARELQKLRDGHVDVVASPRASMSGSLVEAARARGWGNLVLMDLACGAGMWPAFVFARRDALLSTEGTFGARSWARGEVVPGLGLTVWEEVAAADTFTATAFQLRDEFRVEDVPQWKGPHLWLWYLEYRDEWFDWLHVGSLSSGDFLAEDQPKLLALTSRDEKREWAHRLHWWRRCLRLHGDELPEHATRYALNLELLRQRLDVPMELVDTWGPVVDRVVTWNEAP